MLILCISNENPYTILSRIDYVLEMESFMRLL